MHKHLLLNITLITPFIFIGSLLFTYVVIPKIFGILSSRNLIDPPTHKSSHKKATPTMAGIAFFLVLILCLFFIKAWDEDNISINLVASLSIVFIVGLKDDLVMSTPRSKIIGQIVATLFILFSACMEVSSLQGFLGFHTLPLTVSYGLVIFMLVTIINAFNFIDGIDGLASIIGILIFGVYAFIFYTAGLYFYFLLCLSLIGMLLAYLRYNFSSRKKIFMGDTGSLIIGFCIGVFTLRFLAMDSIPLLFNNLSFKFENKLIIISAILYIPLLDIIRIIGVRLLSKKNPFSADRNHIHHILIDLGWSHFKASLLLGLVNLGIIFLFVFLTPILNSFQMMGVYIISVILFLGILYKFKQHIKSEHTHPTT